MAWVIWLTGLPGSGKTSLALELRPLLEKEGDRVRILELDEIRRVLTPEPTYDDREREIVYGALAYMAKLLYEEGVNVLIDATAHLRRYRDRARALIPNFAEVYLVCPLKVCQEREARRIGGQAPRGIYEKAGRPGSFVPGVDVLYEAPERPELIIDAEHLTPAQAAKQVRALINDLKCRTPS